MQHNTPTFARSLLRLSAIAIASALTILPLASISCDIGAKDVYVAGYYSVPDPNYVEGSESSYAVGNRLDVAAVWKNGTLLYRLGDGKHWSAANSVYVSGKDVYVAGYDRSSANSATVWKNGEVMYRLGKGRAEAKSLYVVGQDVFVTGTKETSRGSAPTAWKNGTEHTKKVLALCVHGKDIYVAAEEKEGRKSVVTIQKNGVVEHRLDDGGGRDLEVASLFVSDKDVYAVGKGTWRSGSSVAAIWKNGALTRLVGEDSSSSAESVYVSGNDVYVAGSNEGFVTVWRNGATLFRIGNDNFADYGRAKSIRLLGKDVYVSKEVQIEGEYDCTVWKNGTESHGAELFCISGNDVYLAGRDGQADSVTIWKNGEVKYRFKESMSHANAIFVK